MKISVMAGKRGVLYLYEERGKERPKRERAARPESTEKIGGEGLREKISRRSLSSGKQEGKLPKKKRCTPAFEKGNLPERGFLF